jgi:hypothetical protein
MLSARGERGATKESTCLGRPDRIPRTVAYATAISLTASRAQTLYILHSPDSREIPWQCVSLSADFDEPEEDGLHGNQTREQTGNHFRNKSDTSNADYVC